MADSQISTSEKPEDGNHNESNAKRGGIKGVLRSLLGRGSEPTLRDTFEEILEEHDDRDMPIESDERMLLENILKVGAKTAYDVMVPHADIVNIDIETKLSDVVKTMVKMPHSRYPVYRDNPDNAIGMVHIKDILKATTEKRDDFSLDNVLRDVLFVAPSMRALDLLLEMRMSRLHMALVIDEYGGIDGLVTIEDLVEEIVGDIEDEHDVDDSPKLRVLGDGTCVTDARISIEDLEKRFGLFLSDEEREEDIDTLGGLVFHIAGRVPSRGEIITHEETLMEFEVVEADPRKIKRIRIRNIPGTNLAKTEL